MVGTSAAKAEALGLAGYPQPAPLTEYKGGNIKDWTQKDARTGETIYNPNYLSWQMCPNNLKFRKGYRDYLSGFLTTGIDGLMCDDIQFVPTWHSCGCSYCREEIKKYGEAFLWEERHQELFHQPRPLANLAILFSRQLAEARGGCFRRI